MLVDLESTHPRLTYEVPHDMAPISKFGLGYTNFNPGANHEGQSRSVDKANQLSGRACATFTPSLKLIRSKIFEK
jgi:hypothetical protein